MARVHGIALIGLILLGTGIWFALARDTEEAPTPVPLPTKNAPPAVVEDLAVGRVEQRLREIQQPPTTSPGVETPPPTEPVTAAAEASLELHVRDLVTKAPLPQFQWRWRSGQQTARGDGKDGIAALAIPPATGDLLVECTGYEPATKPGIVIVAKAPLQRLELFLTPIARATGVRLFARDELGNALANLQVACFKLGDEVVWRTGDPTALPAVTATPLWRRRTAAADGVYALPELAPARYSIEAVAVDADGALLPRLPAFCSFEVTGSNAVDEQLEFAPATVLTLELRDVQGNLLDPTSQHGISVRLRRDGDADRGIDWVTTTGTRMVSADAMAAAGPIMARLPLAAGNYSLEIRCHGELRLATRLQLRLGEVQTEPITVP